MFSKHFRLAYLKNKTIFFKKHAKCILYLRVESQWSQGERNSAARQVGRKGIQSGSWQGGPCFSWMVGHGGWDVSREAIGTTVSGTSHEGGVRDKMGQKGRGRDLSANFFCLQSPFSHSLLSLTQVCQKLAGEAWASEVLVWFSLGLRGDKEHPFRPTTSGRHRGGCGSVKRSRSAWPSINLGFIQDTF